MHESSIHQGQSISALFNFPIHTLVVKKKGQPFLVEFMRLTEKMLDIKVNTILWKLFQTINLPGLNKLKRFKPANMNIFMIWI